MNREDIRNFIRDLTGIVSTDVVSDSLINRWISEAYNEIARERDWDWLEATQSNSLPDAVDNVHTVSLSNGTRRVLSAYLTSAVGFVRELSQVSELDHIMLYDDDRYPKYDVNFSGVVTIAPQQPEGETYSIRYTQSNVDLTLDADVPAFDAQFHSAIAYRAAVKVLQFVSDDTDRAEYYFGEYASLLNGMVNLYELNHDDRTFQLGETGQEDRKYFPWFRPA